jgi:aspartyl-tRNA(Asn)/glutamyl-tRNA(Gln) amidotransferase subunit C
MVEKSKSIITEDNVKYLAHLARVELGSEQLALLAKQLEEILGFIDKLKEVDTGNVLPTSHILKLENVLREDSPKASLSPQDALNNAPGKEGSFFVVPKIIE